MVDIQMKPVDSSNLAKVGYDETAKELRVQFHSGGLYAYFNVVRRIYDGLLNAPSKGRYFHQNIRDVFDYSKIR